MCSHRVSFCGPVPLLPTPYSSSPLYTPGFCTSLLFSISPSWRPNNTAVLLLFSPDPPPCISPSRTTPFQTKESRHVARPLAPPLICGEHKIQCHRQPRRDVWPGYLHTYPRHTLAGRCIPAQGTLYLHPDQEPEAWPSCTFVKHATSASKIQRVYLQVCHHPITHVSPPRHTQRRCRNEIRNHQQGCHLIRRNPITVICMHQLDCSVETPVTWAKPEVARCLGATNVP